MLWLVALGCLFGGAVAGALLFKLLKSDEARVQQLEAELQQLSQEYESYKREVHGHFSDSAHLLGKLTESYRDVFQHLAQGARDLCPEYIANQVTQITSLSVHPDLDSKGPDGGATRLSPPLDYVITGKDEPASTAITSAESGPPGRN